MRQVNRIENPKRKILFLGYSDTETTLIDSLVSAEAEVWHESAPISKEITGFDLCISFGYRHILKPNVILYSNCPIVNLHISYLPWNKGAHPNFWSFFDCTPSGVSIHLIDEGVDTGPILFQKYVNFEETEVTFRDTYNRLFFEIENLFKEKINQIMEMNFRPKPQRRAGTYHRKRDLPAGFTGWDAIIEQEIARLDVIVNENQIKG